MHRSFKLPLWHWSCGNEYRWYVASGSCSFTWAVTERGHMLFPWNLCSVSCPDNLNLKQKLLCAFSPAIGADSAWLLRWQILPVGCQGTGTSLGGHWQFLARSLTFLTLRYLLRYNLSVIGTGSSLDPAEVSAGLLIASLSLGTLKIMKATAAGGMNSVTLRG